MKIFFLPRGQLWDFILWFWLLRVFCLFKEGPLTKNGLIDFAQSWAIFMKKSN